MTPVALTMMMTIITLLLLLGMISANFSVLWMEQSPKPPIFPDAFSISFIEVLSEPDIQLIQIQNKGSWYYDFNMKRARYDHDAGQENNFCDNQNLSPRNPRGNCQLFFTPSGDFFVNYPEARNCCRLCGKEEGCTILKPTWLQEGAVLSSIETIKGRRCYGWAKKGAVAAADTWYVTSSGLPCRYHEVVFGTLHNLTFITDTYHIGPQDESLFVVPKVCHRPCPNPFPPGQPTHNRTVKYSR